MKKYNRTMEMLVHLSMMAVQSAAAQMRDDMNEFTQQERTDFKEEIGYIMFSRDQDDLLDIVLPADYLNRPGHIDFFPLLMDERCPEFIDNFDEALDDMEDFMESWVEDYNFLLREVIWKAYWAFKGLSRADVIGYLLESGDLMWNSVAKLYSKEVR